jgi:hypothetical protein
MSARILAGDQDRELERVGQVERRQLFRDRFCDDQVPALQGSPEDRQRMPG